VKLVTKLVLVEHRGVEHTTILSGVPRKFPRGDKFRHNRVTSQSCDVTNQL